MGNKLKGFIFKLGYFVIIIIIISLYLLIQVTQGNIEFEKYYFILLTTTILGIISLFIIIYIYFFKLFRSYKKKVPGSSLTLSLLLRTLLLTIVPIFVISFFSYKFISYDFQSSFDIGIDEALDNSLKLSKKAIKDRALVSLKKSREISKKLAPLEFYTLHYEIEKYRNEVDAYELTVFDKKGFIQAYASKDFTKLIPEIPKSEELLKINSDFDYYEIKNTNKNLQIKVFTSIYKVGSPQYYLKSIYIIPDSDYDLANQVNKNILERDRFNFLKPKITKSFIVFLFLTILVSILLLVFSAISFSRYMTQPIKDLIRGTIKVSQGNFKNPVTTKRKDDFGTLVNSFNSMTTSLKIATNDAEISRINVEKERVYLETIIEYINSAVITLTNNKKLLKFNKYAKELLNCDLEKIINKNLNELNIEFDPYKNFISQLGMKENDNHEKELEIQLVNNKKEINIIAKLTKIPDTKKQKGGFIVIFDDLTKYWEQQKQAAWEEVAQRLAHEIKNPLTPIQLAAERISYKLSGSLDEKQEQILERSVKVITNQVKSMKDMVNEFSDYAKPVTTKKVNLKLDSLINDVFDLYNGHYLKIIITKELSATNTEIKGNINLLRQVLHNIIKNAIESLENKELGVIEIELYNPDKKSITIKIKDNGVGLKDNIKNFFEPYITSKEKGTGLGLAIVKKIIDDHKGTISIENNSNNIGVKVTINLPLIKQPELDI